MTTPSASNTALAEQLCPFLASAQECRPAVALALQSKDDSAALEIDRLKGEIARLRAALEPFVRHYEPWMDDHADDAECIVHSRHTFGDLRKARAALQTEGGNNG